MASSNQNSDIPHDTRNNLLDLEGASPQRKCGGCHISGSKEYKLKNCSGCRCVMYCSRECQVRDWKIHKKVCQVNQLHDITLGMADLAQKLGKPLPSDAPLPPNVTWRQLDLDLEKWIKFHSNNLMVACINALNIFESIGRAKTHILNIQLRYNKNNLDSIGDDSQDVGKYFVMEKTEVLEQDLAKNKDRCWGIAMEQLKTNRTESEKRGRGSIIAVSVECPPLAVQIVPFGSITSRAVRSASVKYDGDWEENLKRDLGP